MTLPEIEYRAASLAGLAMRGDTLRFYQSMPNAMFRGWVHALGITVIDDPDATKKLDPDDYAIGYLAGFICEFQVPYPGVDLKGNQVD